MIFGGRTDPYLNFRFQVEIDSLVVGGFSEVLGLRVETETEEYREGGLNHRVHKLPRVTKQSNITLKRGITDSDVLWEWNKDVVNGSIKRKTGRIILCDYEGREKWHWIIEDAYPVKWEGPELSGTGGTVAVESLELAHNGVKKG